MNLLKNPKCTKCHHCYILLTYSNVGDIDTIAIFLPKAAVPQDPEATRRVGEAPCVVDLIDCLQDTRLIRVVIKVKLQGCEVGESNRPDPGLGKAGNRQRT